MNLLQRVRAINLAYLNKNLLKGAEANLYTFIEKPVTEGIQICFRTLYFKVHKIFEESSLQLFPAYEH